MELKINLLRGRINGTSIDDEESLLNATLHYFDWKDEPPSNLFKHHTWILYFYLIICVHGFIMNGFLLWMVRYRLDFMDSIKVFLSIETFFRFIQCGVTQPLKLVLFSNGWQPQAFIRLAKYVGDVIKNYSSMGSSTLIDDRNWPNKEIVCSIPVHLDISISFGTALFIVLCSSARLYYVSQEKRQRSDNCCQCLIQPSERQFAITFSFFGILAVLIFFILTWIYGFDFGGAFGKACLKPDDTFQMKTFGTFGKIWAFAGFVIFVNILGILVSSSLYFWLRIQDNSMLRNAKQHTKYIGGVAAGQALILLSGWIIHLPFIFFAKSNTMQAFTSTIIIVSANGLIWPYVVIWASSQAKKESLSFLRTIRDVVSTGNFVSFETKKRNEIQNFQHSVVEWKKSERNTKYEKGPQGSVRKSKDDSISISIIQEEGYTQESENVHEMRRKEENNEYKHASPVEDQVDITPRTNVDRPLQTTSTMTTKVEPKEDEMLPSQDNSQLMSLSLLISNHEGMTKRHRTYSRSGLDSLSVHCNKVKSRGINRSTGMKEVKNIKPYPLNNTWTENDMINPKRKLIISDSNESLNTKDLGNLRTSTILRNTAKDIRAGVTNENLEVPVKGSHLEINTFCSLNVPMSTEFTPENSDCPKSPKRIKFCKGKISTSRRQNNQKDKTVDVLKTLISDHDNPTKNNVNTIMDPIRRCNNMTSIHLGDYDDSQIE